MKLDGGFSSFVFAGDQRTADGREAKRAMTDRSGRNGPAPEAAVKFVRYQSRPFDVRLAPPVVEFSA